MSQVIKDSCQNVKRSTVGKTTSRPQPPNPGTPVVPGTPGSYIDPQENSETTLHGK